MEYVLLFFFLTEFMMKRPEVIFWSMVRRNFIREQDCDLSRNTMINSFLSFYTHVACVFHSKIIKYRV